jgi:hypothetical protein
VERFWKTVWDYHAEQTAETEAAVRQFLTMEATRWQYVTGVPDETLVDPESWYHGYALISRPGKDPSARRWAFLAGVPTGGGDRAQPGLPCQALPARLTTTPDILG